MLKQCVPADLTILGDRKGVIDITLQCSEAMLEDKDPYNE